METNNEIILKPGFRNSFGNGWQVMMKNFLRLFLVVVILGIIVGPFRLLEFKFDAADLHGAPWNWDWENADGWEHIFNMVSLGMFAAFFALLAALYMLLVVPVFKYGGKMIFVQAVRKIKPDFEYFVKGFMENYLSIVLANLLVIALVVMGLFALLIPGIIIACRLAFVSYIIMDKKLDPIEAVELSWKMTRGHGWKIFFMGFASFFIFIFGLILFLVGVFPASIWIMSSFASLYEAVNQGMEKPVEAEVVAG
ncbi:MAG: hypothetical protein A2X05_05360 [Bacteroidetes bacterium GWE2_41_25]|nr:MAG: hypothetical protein A2X03_04095 [Bacteroidetes bacterium GWA2_40_15]OFX97237.1 MAG: hypothetical protein A2X06_06610 [Bacteroidetes bacterium GWC2_40_22]OFY08978.1 MAG: hypothetical protein A2X05_05360 [Bacteroidetes bacterium GWE2_41_25]OFY57938.1 MAG: hypothetical protein A2X04_12550 [Bacteroidetes bacterium GWF2_41_9]HBH83333.1 hypothetical protein [Bacteroidales bacterium]